MMGKQKNKWIFKKEVLGKDGIPFTQTKIQTMVNGADDLYKDLVEENGLDGATVSNPNSAVKVSSFHFVLGQVLLVYYVIGMAMF